MIQIDPEQWTHRATDALKLCSRNTEERLCRFLRGSGSAASVVFIFLAFQVGSLRTSSHLMVISCPAGPQVAKNILPLFAQAACSILALPPPLWCGYERGPWNQEEQKAIWQAPPTPGKSSSWRLRQAVWVLLEYWWWHCSRSPPVSSSSDLCSEHAGKG